MDLTEALPVSGCICTPLQPNVKADRMNSTFFLTQQRSIYYSFLCLDPAPFTGVLQWVLTFGLMFVLLFNWYNSCVITALKTVC